MSIDFEQATVPDNSKVEQRISCFSNDNSIIATGLSDGTIKLWSILKEKVTEESPSNKQNNSNKDNSNNNKDKGKNKNKKGKKGKKGEAEKEDEVVVDEKEKEKEEDKIPIDRYRYHLEYIREFNHRKSAVKDMSFNPKYSFLSVVYEDGYCELINLTANLTTSLVLEPPHRDDLDNSTPVKTILKKGQFLSENEFVCCYTSPKKGYLVSV